MALKASSFCALLQPALEKTLGSKWTSIPPSAGRKIVGPALVITDWQRPEPKSGRARLEELFTANLGEWLNFADSKVRSFLWKLMDLEKKGTMEKP